MSKTPKLPNEAEIPQHMILESPHLVVCFLLIFLKISFAEGLQNCSLRRLKKKQIWFKFLY